MEKSDYRNLLKEPLDFLIKKFLLKNKAEVKGMFLTEYDQEKVLASGKYRNKLSSLRRGVKLICVIYNFQYKVR